MPMCLSPRNRGPFIIYGLEETRIKNEMNEGSNSVPTSTKGIARENTTVDALSPSLGFGLMNGWSDQPKNSNCCPKDEHKTGGMFRAPTPKMRGPKYAGKRKEERKNGPQKWLRNETQELLKSGELGELKHVTTRNRIIHLNVVSWKSCGVGCFKGGRISYAIRKQVGRKVYLSLSLSFPRNFWE